ncbi:hypothetical protein B0D71_11515 [Pseudomonas laurylsulfativorans]|uniref:Uncharacterized protein n=1 Tax=Pseudomonas laurylsulfativorans TaxID=1943631 RepID=A0A2S3VQ46_9PSED|nr:hypothetical protein B0D71_11515 [Pseudomonas laurylsulfativorans]
MRCLPKRKAEPNPVPVGASLLAMDVNDNAGNLLSRGVASTIASKLAPTGGGFPNKFKNAGDKKWPKQKYSVAPGSVAR